MMTSSVLAREPAAPAKTDEKAAVPTAPPVAVERGSAMAAPGPPEAATRVVVAEDSLLVRSGVRRLLDLAGIDVVAEVADAPALLAAVLEHSPDVVVSDIRMPPTHGDEGISAATRLRSLAPGVGVVILSQYADGAYARALLEGGSAGRAYLLKENLGEPGRLAEAVRTVAAGGSVVDPGVLEVLLAAPRPSRLAALTPRERDVLDHLALGRSNAAIGQALRVAERSVEHHINALFAKLGLVPEPDVNRRVMAVLIRLEEGAPL